MEVHPEVSDVPIDLGTKLSSTLLENLTWHTDVDKQYTSAISCNISQTQHLCQKTTVITHLTYISIYEYMS